ncbi:MAG: hypothetical protein GDA36_06750 [Rhodobacteraceae bacterium]|nr:hypothetical protein [Paracoccaceae bacterium]
MAKTAASEQRVPRELERACPIRTDKRQAVHGLALRPAQAGRDRGTGASKFDRPGIDPPIHPAEIPRTSGMAKREGGRIGAVLQSHRFQSGAALEPTPLPLISGFTTGPGKQKAIADDAERIQTQVGIVPETTISLYRDGGRRWLCMY